MRSLYKSLQGMVENAKKPLDLDAWDENQTDLASPVISVAPRNLTAYSVDSKDKNVRILLTLSNLQLLRNDVVPELIGVFENAFSVKLTDESKVLLPIKPMKYKAKYPNRQSETPNPKSTPSSSKNTPSPSYPPSQTPSASASSPLLGPPHRGNSQPPCAHTSTRPCCP